MKLRSALRDGRRESQIDWKTLLLLVLNSFLDRWLSGLRQQLARAAMRRKSYRRFESFPCPPTLYAMGHQFGIADRWQEYGN